MSGEATQRGEREERGGCHHRTIHLQRPRTLGTRCRLGGRRKRLPRPRPAPADDRHHGTDEKEDHGRGPANLETAPRRCSRTRQSKIQGESQQKTKKGLPRSDFENRLQKYWTKCHEHETVEAQLHEAQKGDEKKRAQIPGIEKKLAKLKEDIAEALGAYKDSLMLANSKQDWYKQRMPRLIGEYQMTLRSRIDRLKECMREFSVALQKNAAAVASLAPAIDKAIAGINADADIEELAQKAEAPAPQPYVFEPYSANKGSLPPPTTHFWQRKATQPAAAASTSSPTSAQAKEEAVDPEKAHFGVAIDLLVERQQHEGNPSKVPKVVQHLVEQTIALGGAHAKGVFRLAGDSAEINSFRDTANLSGTFIGLTDPHNSAVLLKLWLRSLPDPIVPPALYAQVTGDSPSLQSFEQLPEPNKTTAG